MGKPLQRGASKLYSYENSPFPRLRNGNSRGLQKKETRPGRAASKSPCRQYILRREEMCFVREEKSMLLSRGTRWRNFGRERQQIASTEPPPLAAATGAGGRQRKEGKGWATRVPPALQQRQRLPKSGGVPLIISVSSPFLRYR